MKFPKLLVATALIGMTAFASCKKDDDNATPAPSSSNLGVGKSVISFNTSADFGGSTTFNTANAQMATATRQPSGIGYDNISMAVTEVNTSTFTARTAQFTILTASNSNTANGPLNARFTNSPTDAVYPVLVISAGNGSVAFASETGDVTITKLTDSEIEGSFSGHFVNETANTSIEVSNGKFAGKFK